MENGGAPRLPGTFPDAAQARRSSVLGQLTRSGCLAHVLFGARVEGLAAAQSVPHHQPFAVLLEAHDLGLGAPIERADEQSLQRRVRRAAAAVAERDQRAAAVAAVAPGLAVVEGDVGLAVAVEVRRYRVGERARQLVVQLRPRPACRRSSRPRRRSSPPRRPCRARRRTRRRAARRSARTSSAPRSRCACCHTRSIHWPPCV